MRPIEFHGAGNIGWPAVHGTTYDLAVAGAVPKYLSLGVLLEEGLEFAVLERVVAGIAQAAKEIGVVVAADDSKVYVATKTAAFTWIPAASRSHSEPADRHA